MKKVTIKKKCLLFFLVCVLSVVMPLAVQADSRENVVILNELEILPAGSEEFVPGQYKSEAQAVGELQAQMLKRKTKIILRVKSISDNANALFNRMYASAIEDNEKEVSAGDYLKQNIRSLSMSGSYTKPENDQNYYYTFEMNVGYYTTEKQEDYVNSGVKSIISGLKLSGKADDDKIKAIYDYVTSHVTYDNDSLITDNPIAHTAYSALANGKAVCQGYTSLLYRLLREADIPVRIITGKAVQSGVQVDHAWNIVKISGQWYNMDATWDATLSQGNDQKYQYFLINAKDFSAHLSDSEYKTPQFTSKHPIAAVSYPKYQSLLKKVTGFKASKSGETSISFTWSKLPGVKYYKVAQYDALNNVYKVRATVTSNRATIKGLKGGTKYQFIVVAYDKATNTMGAANTPISVYTNPGVPSPVRLSTKSKSVAYTWKKVSPCAGYELQYSTSSKFTSSATKTVRVSGNASSRKITGLKAGKKYYFRIRSYLTVGSKRQYGAWSAAKNIICK